MSGKTESGSGEASAYSTVAQPGRTFPRMRDHVGIASVLRLAWFVGRLFDTLLPSSHRLSGRDPPDLRISLPRRPRNTL